MTDHSVTTRIDDDLFARLEQLTQAMSRRVAGVQLKRATVIRVALERGICALEAELGTVKPKPKK